MYSGIVQSRHLYGRYLSEFETAVKYYDKVLSIEPDNAWARDSRRRYLRYIENEIKFIEHQYYHQMESSQILIAGWAA